MKGKGIKLLTIEYDEIGEFLERPNRFLGKVRLQNGELIDVHVHDPGRLEELLYDGNRVFLGRAKNFKRKTKWDLIAAQSGNEMILVNSSFHSKIAAKIIGNASISPFGTVDNIRSEVKNGDSRIDFLLTKNGNKLWVEVKGCTLLRGTTALFPDAPTLRGRKHLNNLIASVKKGESSAVLFLVFVNAEKFSPNAETDPVFAETLKMARDVGVDIKPVVLNYSRGCIRFLGEIPLKF